MGLFLELASVHGRETGKETLPFLFFWITGAGTLVPVYRGKRKSVRNGRLTVSKGQEGSTEISKLFVSVYIRYLTLV